jgi:hypothetical protein
VERSFALPERAFILLEEPIVAIQQHQSTIDSRLQIANTLRRFNRFSPLEKAV